MMKKKDRIEILLEDMLSKFDLILEGQASMIKKIDRYSRDMNAGLDRIMANLSTLDQKLDDFHSHLSQKLDSLVTNLTAHETDAKTHRAPYRASEYP